MTDTEYQLFQQFLIKKPDSGNVIKGSGGLRKIRWKVKDQGKRGGVRMIYYWVRKDHQIRMIYAYRKAKETDLSSEQLASLKEIVKRWENE